MTSPGRPRALDHRVEKRAIDARSTEHWLVHPWGAHPRGNGSEPEGTGHRFHAQDGGSGAMSVVFLRFNSPLAHVSDWPRVLGSGASSMWERPTMRLAADVRLSPSLRREPPQSRRFTGLSHLSRPARLQRSRDDKFSCANGCRPWSSRPDNAFRQMGRSLQLERECARSCRCAGVVPSCEIEAQRRHVMNRCQCLRHTSPH